MSTIQYQNLTDLELVREGERQLRVDEIIDYSMVEEMLKRFSQYANNERAAYKKIDRNQLELPL